MQPCLLAWSAIVAVQRGTWWGGGGCYEEGPRQHANEPKQQVKQVRKLHSSVLDCYIPIWSFHTFLLHTLQGGAGEIFAPTKFIHLIYTLIMNTYALWVRKGLLHTYPAVSKLKYPSTLWVVGIKINFVAAFSSETCLTTEKLVQNILQPCTRTHNGTRPLLATSLSMQPPF